MPIRRGVMGRGSGHKDHYARASGPGSARPPPGAGAPHPPAAGPCPWIRLPAASSLRPRPGCVEGEIVAEQAGCAAGVQEHHPFAREMPFSGQVD